jgi:hypothetical protein
VRKFAGLAGVAVSVLALAGASARAAAPSTNGVPAGFPAPPPGAVVYSREDVRDELALGVVRRGSGVLLQASVLDDQGRGATGLAVSLGVGGPERRATACGPGCYHATFPGTKRPAVAIVDVHGGGATTHWRIVLPKPFPPRDAEGLVTSAAAVWRQLRSLTFTDRLASQPGNQVVSHWRIVAPNRVAYVIPHGSASVIIGGKRWDRAADGPWIPSVQDPQLVQPVPFWVEARDAHILGEETFHGHAVWRVSFFDPGTPGWFDILIDQKTLHTLDLHMIATAHFMHDTYTNFDARVVIVPPTA